MTRQCDEVITETRRAIHAEMRAIRAASPSPLSVLDVGCWDGTSTAAYQEILGGSAAGVEIFSEPMRSARSRGIDVAGVDLESDAMPWPEGHFDLAVANQVFEHLKNIWLPLSEIARVVRPGGHLIFSVPNLGSVHNRLMLALGLQPSSIRTFGPHVRGFTYRQLRSFLEYGGYFRIRRAVGVGFYPLPAQLARGLATSWVGGSHTPVVVAQRLAPVGTAQPWRSMVNADGIGEQTFYTA